MIWPLMRFSLRKIFVRTIVFAVLGGIIAIGAQLLYTEAAVEALTEARSQAEPLFRAMGIGSSASLTLHLVSLAMNLLLPIVGTVYAISVSSQLLAGLVESGEMAHFLAAPRSRAAIVRTQASALLAGVLLVTGLPFLAVLLGEYLMHLGPLDADGMMAAFAGLGALVLGMAFLALMFSGMMDTARAAKRRAGLWIAVFFILWMLSRADAMLKYLSFVTPLALYQPEKLALLRPEAWKAAAVLPVLGFMCLVFGTVRFTRRDLPL